jgi:transcriptional regulator with XRE-family HTH domain
MLPEEIKQRRLFLNLTQAELAEKLGVSETAVAHWEQGRRNPDTPKMLEMAFNWLVLQMPKSEKHKQFIAQCQASIEESRAVLRKEAERQRVRKAA